MSSDALVNRMQDLYYFPTAAEDCTELIYLMNIQGLQNANQKWTSLIMLVR